MADIESISAWDFEIYFNVLEAREMVNITQQMNDQFSAMLHSLKVIPELSYHKLQEYPFRKLSSFNYASTK